MQQARNDWTQQQQPGWNVAKLVFLDETAVTTNMTRLRGRSARGSRCLAYTPHGYYKSTTFIAGLRCDGVSAPMVIDGPMDGMTFVTWVREFLCPSLSEGDVAIVKAMLRKAGKRTVDALCNEVGILLDTVQPAECLNYFKSCGYVFT